MWAVVYAPKEKILVTKRDLARLLAVGEYSKE